MNAPAPFIENGKFIGTDAKTFVPRVAHAPNRGVLHLTDVVAPSLEAMARNHANPPHDWWDRRNPGTTIQTVRLDRNARALLGVPGLETNHQGYCSQTEVHDKAATAASYSDQTLENLARDIIVPRSQALGLPYVAYMDRGYGSEAYGSRSKTRMTRQEWATATRSDGTRWGWCSHQNVPGQSHWDGPFDMGRLMAIAREIDQETTVQPISEWPKIWKAANNGDENGIFEVIGLGLQRLGHWRHDTIKPSPTMTKALRASWRRFEEDQGYTVANDVPGKTSIQDFADLVFAPTPVHALPAVDAGEAMERNRWLQGRLDSAVKASREAADMIEALAK